MPSYTLVFSIPELSLSKTLKTITFPEVSITTDNLMAMAFNLVDETDFEDANFSGLLNLLKEL